MYITAIVTSYYANSNFIYKRLESIDETVINIKMMFKH